MFEPNAPLRLVSKKRILIPPDMWHCVNTEVFLHKQIGSTCIWKYGNSVRVGQSHFVTSVPLNNVHILCFLSHGLPRCPRCYTTISLSFLSLRLPLSLSLCLSLSLSAANPFRCTFAPLGPIPYQENGISHLEVGLFSHMCEAEWITCWQLGDSADLSSL